MKRNTIITLISILVLMTLVFTSCGQPVTGLGSILSTKVIESIENAEKTKSVETTKSAETTVSSDNTEALGNQKTVPVRIVKKHGNVDLDTTFKEMEEAGMTVGDIITVSVGDKSYDMPIGTSFNDVDNGNMILRFDKAENEVSLGINMGSFAEATGLAEKKTIDEDPGYEWDIKIQEVGLQLKEKEGYLKEYNARNLERTDNREDYPELSDEEFANFRAVSMPGVKKDLLYRSSSPLDPLIGRNEYAMAATEKAGIRSVVNLQDSEAKMKEYETYPDSYYSGCAVVNPEMNYDFLAPGFGEYVKKSVVFLTENEGPYLIHCREGKDRTGILCALLEAFAGASAEDIKNDYMITYRNFYKIKPGDESYSIILDGNLVKTLCGLFKIDSIEDADLKEKANDYFLSIGITEEQLEKLRSILSASADVSSAPQSETDIESLLEQAMALAEAEDYEAAILLWEEAAALGNADALYELGCCYYYGEGVEQDYEKAVEYYCLAAAQDNVYAQYNLGICYYYGQGVEQDYEKAAEYYCLAADQDLADALFALGCCYYYGEGYEQDYEKAVEYYLLAADQGHDLAQAGLGYCYEYGLGVDQDYDEAIKYYMLAAEQGVLEAVFGIGDCYYDQEDWETATKWYQKAIDAGYEPDEKDQAHIAEVKEQTAAPAPAVSPATGEKNYTWIALALVLACVAGLIGMSRKKER